ncbi:MAG: ester cyclase [Nitrososphaerota archaeon]|nr:ester cyclase [Nitrososphaerota archaeon]MDG6947251.1 ester cyclase [Nitrososphaerota archaeon]MDG6955316.1 ester cyclase [Nitrososphaerota archaeon]
MIDRLAALSSAFSKTQVELALLFAKEDMAAECLSTADHTGHFLGVSPSGKRVSWLQKEIFRLKGGMIIEGWVTRDWLGLLQQLGAIGKARQTGG